MEQQSRQHQRTRTLGRRAALAAGALVLATLAGLTAAGPPSGASEAIPATPPGLAAHYPPSAKEPVHLFAMHGLQESFAGIVVDLFEDDTAGAQSAFSQFQERYRQAAALVPEWRDAYPEAPVQELGAALAGDDRARTMRAYDAVGTVCHRCHVATMVPVQQLYRWGSFATQTVTDPVAGDTGPYASFKHRLAGAFYGIAWDLRQGQVHQARRQLQAFSARFATLGDTCFDCHSTPRRSFTDRDVQVLLEDLGRALEAPKPDETAVAGLSARIGQASCSGCHLVHLPAAMAQSQGLGIAEGGR
jgi:cytochrome c556